MPWLPFSVIFYVHVKNNLNGPLYLYLGLYLCLYFFLCLYLCPYLFLCLYLYLCLLTIRWSQSPPRYTFSSGSICVCSYVVYLCLYLCLNLTLSLSLPPSLALSFSHFLYHAVCLSDCIYLYLCLSFCSSLPLCIYVSFSLSFCLYVSLCFGLSPFWPIPLSLSLLSRTLTHSSSIDISIFLSLLYCKRK